MTAKDKLMERVARLSEAEAGEALRILELQTESPSTDPWGDLGAWSDATEHEAMLSLDSEEAKDGFNWAQHAAR